MIFSDEVKMKIYGILGSICFIVLLIMLCGLFMIGVIELVSHIGNFKIHTIEGIK